jgi:hypothetical protein
MPVDLACTPSMQESKHACHTRCMQAALVPMLAHRERALRHTAGSNISCVVVASGLGTWPQLVAVLQQCLVSSDPAALDGGLDTLYKASHVTV